VKPVWQTCTPRKEVLSGEVKGDIFAAKLGEVVRGTAPDVYQKPGVFFQNTFPTIGLKSLLEATFKRLKKRAGGDALIRLQTTFGGGKTHNFIALWHIARSPTKVGDISKFLNKSLLPTKPINAAGIDGTDIDPLKGQKHGKLTVLTLWGEIAFQLRGEKGYAIIEKNDKAISPPGVDTLAELFGDEPALVIVDELAHYLRVAKSEIAEQTVAFFHRLTEFAASRDNISVVLSLAESRDAYARETHEINEAIKEMLRVVSRREIVFTPTDEREMGEIIRHRLFTDIDHKAARETARRYVDAYKKAVAADVPLSKAAPTAQYAQEIERCYPLHPELLDVLNRKVSTIPNFNKTRGVLRLLAHIIRNLWKKKEPDAFLIHPYHADLSDGEIRKELTGHLDRGNFLPVIQADIYSDKKANPSHSQLIDREWQAKGKPPFAQRLSQVIFLHSLVSGMAAGAEPSELNMGIYQPGLDYDYIERTVSMMVDTFWHLAPDHERYRFTVEPQLNKIIDDEMDNVTIQEVKREIEHRLRDIFEEKIFETVFFPDSPQDVDDNAEKPKLVVLHFDSVQISAAATSPPNLIINIFERCGAQGKYRQYQNNLIFLAAGKELIEQAQRVARRFKALARIVDDPQRLSEFTPEQRKKLKKNRADADLAVRVAVTNAYRYLYYPSGEAPSEHHGLACHVLPPQESAEVKKNQQRVLLKVLRDIGKARTGDDKPFAPAYAMDKVWDRGADSITTEDFRKAFCRKRALPMVLDVNLIKETIHRGIKEKAWVYCDGKEGYWWEKPAPRIELSVNRTLYIVEAAKKRGIIPPEPPPPPPPPPPEICPLCGKPKDQCTCGPPPEKIEGEGEPRKAFNRIRDICTDNKVSKLMSLVIEAKTVEDVRRIALAFSQLPHLEPSVEIEFKASRDGRDKVNLTFSGSWKTFSTVRNFVESISKQFTVENVTAKLTLPFEQPVDVDGTELTELQEGFVQMQVGPVRLEAYPAKSR